MGITLESVEKQGNTSMQGRMQTTIPLIDMTPSDLDTIMTAMSKAHWRLAVIQRDSEYCLGLPRAV